MSLPFLVLFLLITIGVGIAIEVLAQISNKKGALEFLSADASSGLATFYYDYLPVVFALVYGMLWAMADHDFKRLEPFYQLSKPGGVTAEDSLLLDYPYMFVSLAPIKAARRK